MQHHDIEKNNSDTDNHLISTEPDDDCENPPLAKKSHNTVTIDCTSDIAQVVAQSSSFLSDEIKYNMLVNNVRSEANNYIFPKNSIGRSFQYQWLVEFPWLVYSKLENGGYCLPCVLFCTSGYHSSNPGVLVSRPLTSFNKALELLRKHADKSYHKDAILRSSNFQQVMSHQQQDIQSRLSQVRADQIASNRQKLISIFKTVVFCGRQNLALRGHRDNITDIERDHSNIKNHGIFWGLLNFRIDAGDTILQDHFAKAARNATYTSSIIQNQMIDVLADQVRGKIISMVHASKWFTVIADEVTDISNKEILSIALRYVDSATLLVREDYVGFFECDTGISGRHLADKITSCLCSFNLDLSYLRGQAYDGAGNMAGRVNGVATLISNEYPKAFYTHCTSHCLNLAVVKSLQITSVHNMMNVVERVYQFFSAHPKRQRAFENSIHETLPSSTKNKLKDVCRTRWVQRIDAFSVFCSLYQAIVDCMETICSEGPGLWTSDSLTDARGLQLAISTTDFLCALVITNSCLQYLHALTVNLQAETIDIVTAVKEIDSVISTVQNVRENIDTYHSEWFSTVEKMCEMVGIQPSLPRRCSRQTSRNNVPADTPLQYYCRSISIPVLDHLLSEMKSRFTPHHKTALLGLSLVPSVMVTMSFDEFTANAKQLADLYADDLPSPRCFLSELDCWKVKWQQCLTEYGLSSLPVTPTMTLKHATSMYPNIKVLITILCTLPVTSCSAERSFSGLKRSKTAFRSSMTTQRLSGLSILNIHRDIPIDIEAAVDEFCRRHPRRLQMTDILCN
jgi:hypothetical protein